MQPVLRVALHALQQDIGTLQRVAENLANVGTPGYKRVAGVSAPFSAELHRAFARQAEVSGAMPSDAPRPGTEQVIDLRPGGLRVTQRPLDLAIEGEGFFEIRLPTGLAYSRRGDFQLDRRGQLVTAHGYPVMGRGGELVLEDESPTIDASGVVVSRSEIQAPGEAHEALLQIRIVRFEAPQTLTRLGHGLFLAQPGAQPVASGQARVRQGALEASNVTQLGELTHLVATVRHFETMQRVAQAGDELLASAIRRLGDL